MPLSVLIHFPLTSLLFLSEEASGCHSSSSSSWSSLKIPKKELGCLPPGYFFHWGLIYQDFFFFLCYILQNLFFFKKQSVNLLLKIFKQNVLANFSVSSGKVRNFWSKQKHSKCFLFFKATSGERGGYCNGKFHSQRKKGLIINQKWGIRLSFCSFLTIYCNSILIFSVKYTEKVLLCTCVK